MISAFVEAVRATTQPCSLLLVAPALLTVIATRGRWPPLAGAFSGAIAGGWLFAANVVALTDTQLRLTGLVAAGALIVLLGADHVTRLAGAGDARVQPVLAAGLGFVGTLWWRPCVGEELGRILTGAAQDGLAGELLDMAAYMAGAMTPVLVVALGLRALGPSTRHAVWITTGTAAAALLLGGALVLGRHDELVSTLTRWSQ